MEQETQNTCNNCQSSFELSYDYCPNCGQKKVQGIPRFTELIYDLFSTLFNLESKFFQTLKALFIPGRLTKDFFNGKRNSYYKPMRLFTLSFLANLAVLGYFANKHATIQDGQISISKELNEIKTGADSLWQDLDQKHALNDSIYAEVIDVREKIDSTYFKSADSIIIFDGFVFTDDQGNHSQMVQNISVKDINELDDEALVAKYNKKTFFEKTLFLQYLKILDDQKGMIPFAIGNLLWMMILLIPTLALVFHLLYIRRKKYYVEHVIFLLYFHPVAFISISLVLLLQSYLPNYTILIVLSGILIFFFLSMKYYFQQSWFKTFIKLCFVLFCYFILVLVFTMATLLLSMLFY